MDTTIQEKKEDSPAPRAGKLRMSFLLFRRSFSLLKKDSRVLIFSAIPVLLRFFLVTISLIFGIRVWPSYSVFFLIFFFSSLIAAWSRAGVIAIVDERLNDKRMEFKDAWKYVTSWSEEIFLWAFFAATVEVFLWVSAVEFGLFGLFFAAFAWIAWEFGTFYIIPSILSKRTPLSASIEDSFGTIKKNWFETILVNGVFGFFLVSAFVAIMMLLLVSLIFAMEGLFFVSLGKYAVFTPFILTVIRAFFLTAFVALFSAGHSFFSIFNILLYRRAHEQHKDFFHSLVSLLYRHKI
ncbi:MAG: hypothetical protein WC878_02575 [Candidatus Paceibacterota bacterium]|jgi:hypothetical protein